MLNQLLAATPQVFHVLPPLSENMVLCLMMEKKSKQTGSSH